MKIREIENLLISQRERVVPDVFQKVIEKAAISPAVTAKKSIKIKFNFIGFLASACTLFILIISGIFYSGYTHQEMSTVYIDINPSFGLVINRNYSVINVIEPKEQNLSAALNLIGKNAEDAALSIISYAENEGYIVSGNNTDNAMSLTSFSNDAKGNDIIAGITKRLNMHFNEKNIKCDIIKDSFSKDIKDEADGFEISPGKMILIRKILMESPSEYTVEQLLAKPIKELNAIYKSLTDSENGSGNGGGGEKGKEEGGEKGNGKGNSGFPEGYDFSKIFPYASENPYGYENNNENSYSSENGKR